MLLHAISALLFTPSTTASVYPTEALRADWCRKGRSASTELYYELDSTSHIDNMTSTKTQTPSGGELDQSVCFLHLGSAKLVNDCHTPAYNRLFIVGLPNATRHVLT